MSRSARLAAIVLCSALAPSMALADTSISAAGSTALQPLVRPLPTNISRDSDVKISVTGRRFADGSFARFFEGRRPRRPPIFSRPPEPTDSSTTKWR